MDLETSGRRDRYMFCVLTKQRKQYLSSARGVDQNTAICLSACLLLCLNLDTYLYPREQSVILPDSYCKRHGLACMYANGSRRAGMLARRPPSTSSMTPPLTRAVFIQSPYPRTYMYKVYKS
jgi:hypothetical protein